MPVNISEKLTARRKSVEPRFVTAARKSEADFAVIFAALVFATLFLANRWLSSVEANMTINIKTIDYNVAVTADKKKNEKINEDVTLDKNPSK